MQKEGRKVISKSSKRKMSSQVTFSVIKENGQSEMKTVKRDKANGYTEMVVYHQKVASVMTSKTRHEPRSSK